MRHSRLITLLESLSAKEYRELHKFVQSPFFNQREDVAQLYRYLHECLTVHRVVPTKEQAYRHLYGEETYNDHRMRIAMSLLLKLTEQFLVVQEIQQDEVGMKVQLTAIYRQRQLHKHFESALRDAEKLQAKEPYRDAMYFEHQYKLQFERYLSKEARQRIGDLPLQEVTTHLDVAYISRKLRQVCLALSHQAVYRTEYQIGMVDEILNYIKQRNLLTEPAVAIYYHAYHAIVNPSETTFFATFKEALLQHTVRFPPEEQRDLFLLAVNFCMRSYNEGNASYLPDLFELYQVGLEQRYLFMNNLLSRFTYRNIVTLGLILKEYQWVERFIHDYRQHLEAAHQVSMYSFCLARLEYSRRNFDKALRLLQKATYKDLLLNLSAKTVMLKIYYETSEFDLLDSHLQAMQIFLRRKKVMAYHAENYQNLLRFTKKLLEIKPYDAAAKESLRREIEEAKAVAERDWLLKQQEKL